MPTEVLAPSEVVVIPRPAVIALGESWPELYGNLNELKQVVLNLLINALDAIDDMAQSPFRDHRP